MIYVSYLQIYNDCAYDLLAVSDPYLPIEKWPKIVLQEDSNGSLHLGNLSLHTVKTENDALDCFLLGNVHRMVSSTPLNDNSSRSHCMFTLHMESQPSSENTIPKKGKSDMLYVTTSKLHIVDLAGSERAWKTGLTNQLLTEARHINKSLHYLEQVVNALSSSNKEKNGQQTHIPYRNSVLTSILRDSIGGFSKTVLIATVNLAEHCYRESIATCRFAQRCALIETRLVPSALRNNNKSSRMVTVDYKNLSEKLKIENKILIEKLNNRGNCNETMSLPFAPTTKDGKFLSLSKSDTDSQNAETIHSLKTLQKMASNDCDLRGYDKSVRKQLLTSVLRNGMNTKVNCVGDLCLIIQVLLARIEQQQQQEVKQRTAKPNN